MPFKIVRNDITKMQCDAIVNTANDYPTVGSGCDHAIYTAAGFDELLKYRREKIGFVEKGEAFITPAFNLNARYIIHAVSPVFIDGNSGEEEKLRSCYQKSLQLAYENKVESIAFPLISTGAFGYPKEEGMRIAVDEINAFLLRAKMLIYLVVFDSKSTKLGENIYPDLESYIDHNYVYEKREEEYGDRYFGSLNSNQDGFDAYVSERAVMEQRLAENRIKGAKRLAKVNYSEPVEMCMAEPMAAREAEADFDFYEKHESKLQERMEHMSDTFSEYLLYLIEDKGMTNAEVYKRAIVDKKVFSKLKNNSDYHPQKMTAMCLCIGALLNLDETKDLLARAGYALSPCDKTDVIFSYFIENKIYDMIELDIQLEEHGMKCLIS